MSKQDLQMGQKCLEKYIAVYELFQSLKNSINKYNKENFKIPVDFSCGN